MTEQYAQRAINREGFRYVDQTDIDATLVPPAVPLGPDDKFVLCADDGVTGPYQVNMPNIQDCAGVQFTLKNIVGGVAVVIGPADGSGQTFDAAATVPTLPGFSVILSGEPPTPPVPPVVVPTLPTDWSVIKTGAP